MDSQTRRKRQHGNGGGEGGGEVNSFSAWPTTPPHPDVIPSSPDRPPLWLHREISNLNEGGGGGGGINFPSSANLVDEKIRYDDDDDDEY